MEQLHFNKLVKVLRLTYSYYFKDMGKEETLLFNQLYYSKLKIYNYDIVAKAIDKIITTSKYMPTLAELVEECEKQKKLFYKDILMGLYQHNYFKDEREYNKVLMWFDRENPIIPGWLKEDIDKILGEGKIKQLETEENKNGNIK